MKVNMDKFVNFIREMGNSEHVNESKTVKKF